MWLLLLSALSFSLLERKCDLWAERNKNSSDAESKSSLLKFFIVSYSGSYVFFALHATKKNVLLTHAIYIHRNTLIIIEL